MAKAEPARQRTTQPLWKAGPQSRARSSHTLAGTAKRDVRTERAHFRAHWTAVILSLTQADLQYPEASSDLSVTRQSLTESAPHERV